MAYIDSARPRRVYHRLPDGRRPHRTFHTPELAAQFVRLVAAVGWAPACAHVDSDPEPGAAAPGALFDAAVAAGADPGRLRRTDPFLPPPPQRRAAGVSLVELCLRHIAGLDAVTAKTRADYRGYVVNHIGVFFGDLDAGYVLRREHPLAAGTSALTMAGFRAFLEAREAAGRPGRGRAGKPLSGKKVKEILNFCSSVYGAALREDYARLVDENPARGMARGLGGAAGQAPRVFLTPEQFRAVLPHMPAAIRDHVEMLAHTGLRWAEMAGLRARDVELDPPAGRPYLRVVTALHRPSGGGWELGRLKTPNALRSLSLTPRLEQILRRRLAGKSGDDLVFTSATGLPLHHNNFCRSMEAGLAAAAAAGLEIPSFRPHALRHSHAAWLLSAGRTAAQVAFQLGHASEKTTMKYYGHLVRGGYDANAEALQGVLDAAAAGRPGPAAPTAPGTPLLAEVHPGAIRLSSADAALPLLDEDEDDEEDDGDEDEAAA